jgi:hypothetical protein
LSGIIPTEARGVVLRVIITNNTAQESISFRKEGNSNQINIARIYAQVDNISIDKTLVVPVNVSNRKIEYNATNVGTWSTISIIVMGWF